MLCAEPILHSDGRVGAVKRQAPTCDIPVEKEVLTQALECCDAHHTHNLAHACHARKRGRHGRRARVKTRTEIERGGKC